MTDEASQLIAEAYADLRTVDLDENRARYKFKNIV
jgi:hypothetical protein